MITPEPPPPFSVRDFKDGLNDTSLAFRGYNVTNLGRTPELLAHPQYGPIVVDFLQRGSVVCADVTGRRVDLVRRVHQQRDTSLATYHEAIALVMSVSLAQLELLRQIFDIDPAQARMAYGFSLGEITALVAGGVVEMEDALRIPLSLSRDSVELASDVTLGVLFSRTGEISLAAVERLCQEINFEEDGVVGISAVLSPNSILLIGQHTTLDRVMARRSEITADRLFMRKNEHRWPPLHTPISWQKFIPNRAMVRMHTMPCVFRRPRPPVLSLVTGDLSYDDFNARELIGKWVDHPQRLWDAVDKTLSTGINTVVHVGPQPNIIPATFDRLKLNVEAQTAGKFSAYALRGMANRPWLQAILPKRTSLLRATQIRQLILEDWLLEQELPS